MYVHTMSSNTSSTIDHGAGSLESVDAAEQTLITAERHIAILRGIQLQALDALDQAQVATADGSRNLAEWVAARVDIGPATAKDLVSTMRRTQSRPDLRAVLTEGEATFDRMSAAALIAQTHEPDPLFSHLDITGVRGEASRRDPIDYQTETRTFADRFLVMQPSLDESWWKLWGGFDGLTGAIIDRALSEAADLLPCDPEAPRNSSWRRATALAAISVGDETAPSQVTLFVDSDMAGPSNGRAGIYLEAGPRVGKLMLEAILCDAELEVVALGSQGEPIRYGRRSRTVPPVLRRSVLHRDGNRCAIDGCGSRNRLQIHHIIPWSQGGTTDPENLLTLCWYHHHVAIHQHRLTPRRHQLHGRWRLSRAPRAPPDHSDPLP